MSDELLFEADRSEVCNEAFASFVSELDTFMAGKYPNLWIFGDDIISVYTRKGHHAISGAIVECLDIATITIGEQFRNRGLGMRVINHMHKVNPYRFTYVESILNDNLYDRLIRNGWRDVPGSNPKSVFKTTPLKTV